MSNIFLDFHAIHPVGPANINRDDTGSPKSTELGGVRRARVSSQAWKRAIRNEFAQILDASELGERTLRAIDRVAAKIVEKRDDFAESAEQMAIDVLEAAGIKKKELKKKDSDEDQKPQYATTYLLFLARRQIEALADLAIEAANEGAKVNKKAAKAALNDEHSIDIALFGRMIADAADLKADAACQVAHAISVHPLETEFDYFTAVDDNQAEDNAGAGMLGTIEFNASVFYRYATINLSGLIENLGSTEAAKRAVAAFAQAFATSMPTGKQNTFANRTRPELLILSVRDDQPVSFVDAFEDAVVAKTGRITQATKQLVDFAKEADEAYGSTPTNYYLAIGGAAKGDAKTALSDYGTSCTLEEIVNHAQSVVPEEG